MARPAEQDRARGARAAIVPATPSPRVRSVFAAMVGRMLRRDFHAVRLARGSRAALEAIDGGARPALVVLNHASWWDPLVAISAWRAFFPSRAPYGPIDRHELARFAIFRKVGLFGVDPDDPATLGAMRGYLAEIAARDPRFAFVLTPQGAFADVREKVVPRPGAAAIAAALAPDRAVSIAIEYAFWTDRKPEVFVRAEPIACAGAGLLGWQRRIAAAMQSNQDALAALVRARDAAAFEPFAPAFTPRTSGANPFYDLWMRLTGRRVDAALGEAREVGRGAERGGARGARDAAEERVEDAACGAGSGMAHGMTQDVAQDVAQDVTQGMAHGMAHGMTSERGVRSDRVERDASELRAREPDGVER